MRRSATRRKKLSLVAIISNRAPSEDFLAGVAAYVERHPEWQILPSARGFTHGPEHLPFVEADGYILPHTLPSDQRAVLMGKDKPVVCLGHSDDFPFVAADGVATGVLAAEHLIDAGYPHLARLCFAASYETGKNFDRRAAEAGRPVAVLEYRGLSVFRDWPAYRKRIADWLRKLDKPVGIFCESDFRAIPVVRICLELGIAVPHSAGVIGVQDERHQPDCLPISLTSVRSNEHEMGEQCVRMLDALARGEAAPSVLVPPSGIRPGVSTDVSLAPDPVVAKCLSILRARMREGLRVQDLAREVRLSRRMLQTRFLKALGHTPHQELERSRVSAACQLLAGTELTVTEIAVHCGYPDVRGLCVAFKRNTGLTPSEYRIQHHHPRTAPPP